MNNPISSRPEYALWPDPPNCTGWRLWKLLEARNGATQDEYVQAFDRRNLLPGKVWNAREARAAALRMVPDLAGRTVVLLGQEVRHAFRIPKLLIHPQEVGLTVWRQLPHPSGLNHWFNEEVNRAMAGMLLAELMEAGRCTH
jgi:hypothetical protein